MKKIMGQAENLFCAGYLLFAFVTGFVFLGRGGDRQAHGNQTLLM